MAAIPLHPSGEWQRDLLGRRLHTHVHATTGLALERYFALGRRKNRVIFADADVQTGMVLGAALADDDVAGSHGLTTILFDAEPASGGIASIAG